jgi:hypothetical protein
MKPRLITSACAALGVSLALPVLFGLPPSARAQTVFQPQVVQPKVQFAELLWPRGASDEEAIKVARQRNTVAVWDAFLRDYPNSRFVGEARQRRAALLGEVQRKTTDLGSTRPIILPPKTPAPTAPPPAPAEPPPKAVSKAPLPRMSEVTKSAPPPPPPATETKTFEMRKEDPNAGESPPEALGAPPRPPGPGSNTSGSGVRTVIEAVMTELLPTDQRRAQNGGAAIVLLTAAPGQSARNAALCSALFTQLDTATTGEIDVGVRRVDGVVQILRPVYWFMRTNRQGQGVGPEGCTARLQNYHFARARSIMTQVGLTGEGPFLAVVRTDDRAAGVIDLSRASPGEIAQWVRYFRESYSKRDRIWAPETSSPEATRRDLIAYFGDQVYRTLTTAPRVVLRQR